MRYPGGKGRAFQRIINLMPPHRVYIETHLGGGAVLRNKRRAERTIGIDRDPKVVAAWRARAGDDLELHEGDAADFLRRYQFGGGELVYCDPPYLPSTRRRSRCYRYDYDEAAHIQLLAELRRVPCSVMLSGYPSRLYDTELADWRRVEITIATQAGRRDECIWLPRRDGGPDCRQNGCTCGVPLITRARFSTCWFIAEQGLRKS
jgi:site-specific DNA-adenine methylase